MARTQLNGRFITDRSVAPTDLSAGSATQILVCDASGNPQYVTLTGDATISATGVITVGGGGDPSFKRVTSKSAAATLTVNDAGFVVCDATTASFQITLPTAASCNGYTYTFMKSDATVNTVNLKPTGAELLDGLNTVISTLKFRYQTITIKSNGTSWFIVSGGPAFNQLLVNKMPSFFNDALGIYESVQRYESMYIALGSTRNVTLSTNGNSSGSMMPRNGIIKSIWAQSTTAALGTANFQIMKNGSATVLATLPMTLANTQAIVENVNLLVNKNDMINVFLSSTTNLTDPSCWIEFAWRD